MTHAARRLVVLGSTGSIGTQTLDVVERLNSLGFRIAVTGLSAGRNAALLVEQVERFGPRVVSLSDEQGARELRARFPDLTVLTGESGLLELARLDGIDVVANALVGAIGLAPTLAALDLGRTVGLANKESLVIGGELVLASLREHGGSLLPIDSEHSAALQCLQAGARSAVRRLVLTASGGPFLHRPESELASVRPEEALHHPSWRMGSRVTVDSATMVNKAFEVIEAHHLFSLPYERIDVVIHPGSAVHAFVEYVDGSILAELAAPDMRIPIQYALTYPERADTGFPRLDLLAASPLRFEPLDPRTFPAFHTVLEAARCGGVTAAAANAADEVLVERFLTGEIPFNGIALGLERVLEREHGRQSSESPSLPELLRVDAWAREIARSLAL